MRTALKEWAVICQLLASGWQSVILRKGGLADAGPGFEVKQRFWLLPTWLHQQQQGVAPAALPVLERVLRSQPAAGTLVLSHFAEAIETRPLHTEAEVRALGGLHFWTEDTVLRRFHYREPGLSAIVVRVHAVSTPRVVPDLAAYAGCRSWVELEEDLPCLDAVPVLSDAEFALRLEQFHRVCA